MASNKLLNCLKKRDLLNSERVDRTELVKLGERYAEEGRLSDSIDLFEKSEHLEGLVQLKARCVAEGDYFLFHRLARILEDSPTSEEWIRLGDEALGQGKLLFARSAYRQAKHSEKLAQVERLLRSPSQNITPSKDMLH